MNNENSVPSSLYREEGNDTGEKGSPADSLEDTVEAGQTSSGAEKRDLTDTDTGSEDFTTSVAGVDDFCDVALAHQRVEDIELLLLIILDTETKAAGKDGQIFHIPLGVARIIVGGISQLCQMPITPGNEITVALQITPSLLTAGSNDCGNGFCHRRLFSNDQFIFAHTPSCSDAGSYCSNSAYSPSSSSSPKS